MKTCYKCHNIKSLTEFYKHRGTSDGLDAQCKDCAKERSRLQRITRAQTIQRPPEGITSKRCSRCRIEKSLVDFYKNKSGTWDLEARCKQCAKANYKEIQHAGIVDGVNRTGPARRCHLMTKYGMPLEEYLARVKKQNNLCAICQQPETAVKKGALCNLCVDHDHKTLENRDLLCDRCNRMIGSAEDSPELLEQAAQYLRRHRGGDSGNARADNSTDFAGADQVAC